MWPSSAPRGGAADRRASPSPALAAAHAALAAARGGTAASSYAARGGAPPGSSERRVPARGAGAASSAAARAASPPRRAPGEASRAYYRREGGSESDSDTPPPAQRSPPRRRGVAAALQGDLSDSDDDAANAAAAAHLRRSPARAAAARAGADSESRVRALSVEVGRLHEELARETKRRAAALDAAAEAQGRAATAQRELAQASLTARRLQEELDAAHDEAAATAARTRSTLEALRSRLAAVEADVAAKRSRAPPAPPGVAALSAALKAAQREARRHATEAQRLAGELARSRGAQAAAAQAAQAAADAASGDDAEMAQMEAHMAGEEARLSAMRAQMAEKQREAASRRAQRAAEEAAAAEAALEAARGAAAQAAAQAAPSPPASPAKKAQAAPPVVQAAAPAAVAAPVVQAAPPAMRTPTPTPPPPAPAPPAPAPVAVAAPSPSPEPEPAPEAAPAPPAPPSPERAPAPPPPPRALTAEEASAAAASAEAAYLAEAAARAEAIAEAEAAYHNALSVAELLEIQAAETEELRREDTEAARYMGGEEVRAAQQAAEAARRRAAAGAIRTAQARLAALRRADSDAAAAYAAACGAPPPPRPGAERAEVGSAYGDAASPRWPGASPKRGGAARPAPAAPAAPVPYYVPVDVPYDPEEEREAAPDPATAAALAAVSRRAHTLRAGDDPYTPVSHAGDMLRAAIEVEAAAAEDSEAPIPGMPGLPTDVPTAAYVPDVPDEGLLPDDEGGDDARDARDGGDVASEEADAWMAEEEAHRAQMRTAAARAAAARAMAAEAESYIMAGPGSRPVDADKAWRLAARLAGGGVEDKALPPALAACTAALLGAPSAARAGAWGLHEAVAQPTPKELFYLHGSQLLAPLSATVAALTRSRASADWFATHFAAAALRQLTEGDLSAKYWIEGELGEADNLAEADVFFDPGPHGRFELPDDDDLDDVTRRQLEPPEPGRECLLLVKGDRELEALVRAAAAVQPRLGSRGSTPAGLRARLSALAQWVCTRCGGPGSGERVSKSEKQSALLAAHGGPLGLVPLARVTQGLARHRAILFKFLTDKLFVEDAVRCRLVRAPRAIAPQGAHVWNVVVLAEPDEAGEVRDVHLLVDLMAERLHGSLEPRLVDERGAYAMEYKATAGFTAYRLEKPPPRPPASAVELQRVRALPQGTFGGCFVARSRHSADGDALYCAKEFTPLTTGAAAEAAVLELPALKACRHPNVAPVRVLLPRNDVWYLLTDLHTGGSWDGALKAQPRDATARGEMLLRFALETACGMAYLHSRRIAHCDLKPSNLLLTPGGGVAVTDYGLSHLLPPAAQAARVAHWSGSYMAPEARLVMSGGAGGELTPAADVWSFGVCVGQALLHGEYPAPLPAPGTAAAMSAHTAALNPYNDAAIAAAEAPRALAAVYRACLAKQPAQRPRFDALVEELERAAKSFCAGQRDG